MEEGREEEREKRTIANDVASAVGRPNKFPSSGPPPGLPCFCLARPAKYGDASKQVSFWLSFKDKKHGGRVLRKRVRIMLNGGRIGLVAIGRFIVEILACIEDINQGWQMEAKIYMQGCNACFQRVTRATWIKYSMEIHCYSQRLCVHLFH